jgi:hypothetical protein
MVASVVLGRHLDIQMVFATVDVPIFDLAVRELHVPVPVRQVVFVSPLLNLACVAVRPSGGVRPVPIALVQPLLVFNFQLVLQAHAFNLHSSCLEASGVTLVRAVDLAVVFEFAFPLESRVEGLSTVPFRVAVGFQQVSAAVRQDYGVIAIARDADGLDEALFSEVPQVAIARIGRPIVTVPKVAGRDDTKRSNRCEGAGL